MASPKKISDLRVERWALSVQDLRGAHGAVECSERVVSVKCQPRQHRGVESTVDAQGRTVNHLPPTALHRLLLSLASRPESGLRLLEN